MTFLNSSMPSHYDTWAATEMQDERWCQQPILRSNAPSWPAASRSPSVQPINRYLQEPIDRQLYRSSFDPEVYEIHSYPDIPYNTLGYYGSGPALHSLPQRRSSPSSSGLSSSGFSSVWSEDLSPPWMSPDVGVAAYTPLNAFSDIGFPGFGKVNSQGPCVALHDVQGYADAQPEKDALEDDHTFYGSNAHEGYQSMHAHDDTMEEMRRDSHQCDSHLPQDDRKGSNAVPDFRRRRASAARSFTSPRLATKIAKQPANGKRSSSYQGKVKSVAPHDEITNNRAFPCPFAAYGCSSIFASKNEWKRHAATQHMRLGYWRCDQCPHSGRKPNDFNRKDLFIQHVRRMHPMSDTTPTRKARTSKGKTVKNDVEELLLAETSGRCFQQLRSPPDHSACFICDATFEGTDSWNARMEHIGTHMEIAKKDGDEPTDPAQWNVDENTESWLANEGIITRRSGRWVLV